jgi:antitoxin component YwqK of YwqJK toxin-antitoxin module
MRDGVIIEPLVKTYYSNGTLHKVITIAKGKRNGPYKEYYDNGQLAEESIVEDDDIEGQYTSYYRNGKAHIKANYKKGKVEGPYQEFDTDGKLIERGEYHNGRKSGTTEMLTSSGRVYGTITYRKDAPVAFRFTDDDGKVLATQEDTRDMTHLLTFRSNGSKLSDLPYQGRVVTGDAIYYYPCGNIKKRVTFVEDKLEGPSTEYHLNGQTSSVVNFHNDVQSGYYTSHTDAGVLHAQGFLHGSNRYGLWKYNDAAGKLSQELFFIADDLNGPAKNYLPNGRLNYVELYDHDMIVGLVEYDTLGKETNRVYFPAGNGEYVLHGPNGKPVFTCSLRNGSYNGTYLKYFPNGSVSQKGYYRAGTADSLTIAYHPNGIRRFKGFWANGKRIGEWIDYDPAGMPERIIQYNSNGEQDGPERRWVAGILHTSYAYRDGSRERDTLFGDGNNVAAILIYRNDVLAGYTYMGTDGKEMPEIPVKAGTAHVVTAYPNGQKAVDYTFNNGYYDGPLLKYYSNGQKAQELNYKGNLAEGDFRRWSPSGQLLYEVSYHKDIMVGEEKTWDAKGQLISSATRNSDGTLQGSSMSFDPATGKKAIVQNYNDLELSMQ